MLIGLLFEGGNRYLAHFLYADDCLVVAKASMVEVRIIIDVLSEYCMMSGQRITLDKSQIIFGVDMLRRHRNIIKRILHIN